MLLALLALAASGCVRRRLTVRTNVPGAQVYVDDQLIGTTPDASTKFVYYGTRKIQLVRDRYKTVTLYERIKPPWYQLPPIDFVAENLIPWEIRDERVVEVQMEPQVIEREDTLLQRAEQLRATAGVGR